ncbi:MAG: hypothetical protein RIS64_1923 [Bacteroidota bacterium]|jgi:predicted ATP-binding protein involved in virulence
MRLELKLKEVHLQNFRLFDDLKVSFDEQLTVFISENGAVFLQRKPVLKTMRFTV